MGRSRVVSKKQRPRSQMNKLLLVFAIGLGLLALAAGSSEEQNQVDSFESGLAREAREADPGKQRQNKGVNKRKRIRNARKNNKRNNNKNAQRKKAKNNKRNNNKNAQRKKARSNNGKKGQRKNRNKKRNKNNGKRNNKNAGKGQKKNMKNDNKKRKNQETQARQSECLATSCVDNAVKAMKLLKDKVLNFEKQEKRIAKKSNIGSKKSDKQDDFKPTLQRLSDAAGGNLSAPVCSGSTDSAGAATMLGLAQNLSSCADSIHAACDTSNLPAPNATKIAECKAAIATLKGYTDECAALEGAAACECWMPNPNVTAAMAVIKTCDLSKNNTAMVDAVKGCKAAFGKCRKEEDSVGDIIFACEQSADTLKLKLKALSDNSDKVAAVASKVDALVNASSRGFPRARLSKRDATTAAGFISICTQINVWVNENPYYYQIASFATTIITVTAPVFDAAALASLSAVNAVLQVSVTVLQVAVVTLQTTILELTGEEVSQADLDALPECTDDPDVCYADATTVTTPLSTTTGTTMDTTAGSTSNTTTGTR